MIGMEAETPRWSATDLLVALCACCLIAAWSGGRGAESGPDRVAERASLDISRINRGGSLPPPPTKKSASPTPRKYGYRIVLGREGAVIQLKSPPSNAASRIEFQNKSLAAPGAVFGIKLAGADALADPKSFAKSKSALARVVYPDVYPNIDWVWLGARDQIEYDFLVRPGGDPRKIRLAFENVGRVEIDRAGDLILHLAKGKVRQAAPYAYQLIGGARKIVEARYVSAGKEGVGIRIGKYDSSKPLVID